MKTLDLYKFVTKNSLEYHWHERNDKNNAHDVILFVPILWIEEFNKMLGTGIMDEEGIDCTMKDGYFCFWMDDICGYFHIELEEVFDKEG